MSLEYEPASKPRYEKVRLHQPLLRGRRRNGGNPASSKYEPKKVEACDWAESHLAFLLSGMNKYVYASHCCAAAVEMPPSIACLPP